MMIKQNKQAIVPENFNWQTLEILELQEKVKERIIISYADMLFDKIMIVILEAGLGFSVKEVKMSLYKRKRSKYFYVDVTYNNLRIRKSTKCENKRDAEKVKLYLLFKMMGFVPDPNQNQLCLTKLPETTLPSFTEVSQKYLEEKASTTKSFDREKLCHRDVVKYFGTKRIDKITSRDIHTFLQAERNRKCRGGKNISPRTINYNRGYLYRVFEFAINVYGWIEINPVKNIKPLPQDNIRDRILSSEEEDILLGSIEKEWLRDVVKFTLATSLRISEVAELRKSNFFIGEEIPFFKLKREKGNTWTEFPIISPELMDIIKKYLYTIKGDIFFCDESGEKLNSDKIYNHYKRAVKKAGLLNLVFHDLRRTFFSRLRLKGCNQTVAEYLMGHKEKELTRRYLAYDLRLIAEELKRIESLKDIYGTHTSHFKEIKQFEDTKKVSQVVV